MATSAGFEGVIAALPDSHTPVLVAVDGVDGSGKTTFAGELAARLRAAGRPVLVVHEDNFLNPRATRYRLGRHSPEGFFLDTYDLAALERCVLSPLRPGPSVADDAASDVWQVVPRVFDHVADAPVPAEPIAVPPRSVVIVEGMFLHRDELAGRWDVSVFLDVPFAETARRMSVRDGSHPDPEHPSMRRYVEGQRLYLARCSPRSRATVVVDG